MFSNVGFDYGIKPHFMVVGDLEFSDYFTKANCLGLLYMFGKTDDEKLYPIQIAFIFQNEEPAEKFFSIVLGWIERSGSNGDAVSIDFIENNDGGYTVAISPETDKLIERIIPKNLKNRVLPLVTFLTHYKKIDTLSENYLNFKSNCKCVENIAIGYIIGTPNKIEKQSKRFFTKTQFHFYKEGDIPKNSNASSYKALHNVSHLKPDDFSKPHKDSLETISNNRISELRNLLPLTYRKLQNGWLNDIQIKLNVKYNHSLIVQAICNLIVFERMKKTKKDLTGDDAKNLSYAILDYLVSTYESFDSYYPPEDFFSERLLITQIENDKKELENYMSN